MADGADAAKVQRLPGSADKRLYTPGPLTTSRTVKHAMLRDLGSRDLEFIATVRDIRRRLVALGGVSEKDYTCVLQQGSGTFGLESVVASTIPPDGKMLVAVNGAYGHRVVKMTRTLGIPVEAVEYPENIPVSAADIDAKLAEDPAFTHVSVTHCETTTGIMNPIKGVGEVVAKHGKVYFIDAMSSFGAVPTNLDDCHVDYLVSSANKDIEGVPGFSFILAKLETLKSTEGWSRSLTMDLLAQYEGLEANGQFRFTPPTHSLLAYHQALLELEAEGGVEARGRRYQENFKTLLAGMVEMGFRPYLREEHMGYIITTYHYPRDENFDFEQFYRRLSEQGYVIYPGKLTQEHCFRLGNIGRLFPQDMRDLLSAIKRTLVDMNVTTI
ncbi:MAG: 2-aminoethylphosphonate--pyruvate transaminase [Planctomycetota bacterium]|jgi:2-aminoethylphosphonate-pyruvate transaminase